MYLTPQVIGFVGCRILMKLYFLGKVVKTLRVLTQYFLYFIYDIHLIFENKFLIFLSDFIIFNISVGVSGVLNLLFSFLEKLSKKSDNSILTTFSWLA